MNLPNTNKILLRYAETYPMVILNYSSKWYKDFGGLDLTDGVFSNNTAHTHSIPITPAWTYETEGTHYTSYDETDNTLWYQYVINQYTANSRNETVQIDQWGTNTAQVVKHVDVFANPEVGPSIASYLNYDQTSHSMEGTDNNTLGAVNIIADGILLPTESSEFHDFEHLHLTGIAGEVVRMGGGAPLLRSRAGKDTDYRVTLDLLTRNADGVGAGSPLTVRISTAQFTDGNFTNPTDKIYEGTVTTNTDGTYTLTFDLDGIDSNKVVWYNLFSGTENYSAECTNCQVDILS